MCHFLTLLWEELQQAGLIADSAQYRNCLAKVAEVGTHEQRRLKKLIQSSHWREANAALGLSYSNEDLIRVLGFGRLLTEVVVSPVTGAFKVTALDKVIELGSLSNLIVTIYDQYLDLMPGDSAILTRRALERMALGQSSLLSKWMPPRGLAPSRVMFQLITAYFNQLNKLPYALSQPSLRNFIQRIIISMYDAEMVTVRQCVESPSERMLCRKSALPFVIMGLPIWLAVPEVPGTIFWRHLRWSYSIGEFIGWIDDAVDLEADRATGHPNRVHNALVCASDVEKKQGELARRIARLGKRLFNSLGVRAGPCSAATLQDAGVLSSVIVSWFGGVPPRA